MATETRIDPERCTLYFADKPIGVSTSTKIELKDEWGIDIEPEDEPWYVKYRKSPWEEIPSPQSFTFNVDLPNGLTTEIYELLYNYIIPYWQANHRGNSLHYISMWGTVKKYLSDENRETCK